MKTEAGGGRTQTGAAVSEPIDEAIRGIELALAQEDPEFVAHMRKLEKATQVNAIAVISLLAVSAVLLIAGLATLTYTTWAAGALAFIGAFAVDHRYQRVCGPRHG